MTRFYCSVSGEAENWKTQVLKSMAFVKKSGIRQPISRKIVGKYCLGDRSCLCISVEIVKQLFVIKGKTLLRNWKH